MLIIFTCEGDATSGTPNTAPSAWGEEEGQTSSRVRPRYSCTWRACGTREPSASFGS